MLYRTSFFTLLVVSAAFSLDDTDESASSCGVAPSVKSPACLLQRSIPQEMNTLQSSNIATEHNYTWATIAQRQATDRMSSTPVDCTKADCQWTKKWNCPGQAAGTEQPAEDDGSVGFNCCCLQGMWRSSKATATPTAAQVDCSDYTSTSACSWTEKFNCPGQPAGTERPAENDNSTGYKCCCLQGMWRRAMTTMTTTQALPPGCPDKLQCSCLPGQHVNYKTDEKGCQIDCKCVGCAEPPTCSCPAHMGQRTAYDTDENGCKTNCRCESDPTACPPKMLCACAPGQKVAYEKDERGCATSCNCTAGCPALPLCGCPTYLGSKTVYETDENGCKTRCRCTEAPTTTTTTQVLPAGCGPKKLCACRFGQNVSYEKDEKGCITDCKCTGCPKPPVCGCPAHLGLKEKYDMDENGCKTSCSCEDDPEACPPKMLCACKPGQKVAYEKDDRGCTTGCKCTGCAEPPLCDCPSHLGVERVFDTDADGCKTNCHCKKDTMACPPKAMCLCPAEQKVAYKEDSKGCIISCECTGPTSIASAGAEADEADEADEAAPPGKRKYGGTKPWMKTRPGG
mmetsp:Transcript_57213/g.100141  ORF Transcript_57213/g.100141 Transcript_57213/m.100141 type:complete len:568 (-) Transcript_57213:90-1793(-)